MAGDWLKFEKSTPDKPEVFAIAADLDIDPDAVVGKLMRIWSWFDSHTENGNAPSVTSALLDRIAGVSGFVQSMQKCGWIVVESDGISLPNFDRHCGITAKQRAQNNKRVSKLRARNADSVTEPLQKHVPEKRREEKIKEEKLLSTADAVDPCPHEEIIALYHQHLPMLTQVRVWNDRRKALLRARWREDAERQSLDWWEDFFKYVAGCRFLLGHGPSRDGQAPWQADLEWLVNPSNMTKVIEGKYARDAA